MMLQLMLFIIFSTSVQCEHLATRAWIVNTNVTIGSRYWDSLVTIGSFTFNGSMTHAVAIPTVKGGLEECVLIYPLDKLPSSVSSDLYNTTEEGKCVDEGAVVRVRYDKSTFVYKKLEAVVRKFVTNQIEQMKYEVYPHMSKVTKSNYIQIVLLPKNEYSNELLDMANGLRLYLEKPSSLGISACWTEEAGAAIDHHKVWSTIAEISAGLAITLIAAVVLVYAKKLKWFEGAISVCKGLKSTQLGEDRNLTCQPMTPTDDKENNTQNETDKKSASVVQHEQQVILIDTSDRPI